MLIFYSCVRDRVIAIEMNMSKEHPHSMRSACFRLLDISVSFILFAVISCVFQFWYRILVVVGSVNAINVVFSEIILILTWIWWIHWIHWNLACSMHTQRWAKYNLKFQMRAKKNVLKKTYWKNRPENKNLPKWDAIWKKRRHFGSTHFDGTLHWKNNFTAQIMLSTGELSHSGASFKLLRSKLCDEFSHEIWFV